MAMLLVMLSAFEQVPAFRLIRYGDDPGRALQEAARVLKPGGRLLIADFAPHGCEFLRDEHAHRRLGIAKETMVGWLQRAGLETIAHETLAPPEEREGQGLTVSLWLVGRDRQADG